MRLKYVFPSSPAEDEARRKLEARIDLWWQDFAARAKDLPQAFRGKLKFDFTTWTQNHFHDIHPEIMWEFGPGVRGGERLAISAEANFVLQPLVDLILERAPVIPNWTFIPYRPAVGMKWAEMYVKARTGLKLRTGANAYRIKVSTGHYNKIDLAIYSAKYSEARHKEELKMAGTAVQYLLGEEFFYNWLGALSISKLSVMQTFFGRGLVSLPLLKPRVDALMTTLRDQLYPEPMWKGGWQNLSNREPSDKKGQQKVGTMFKLNAKKQDVYPRRTDEYVAVSEAAKIWEATHLDSEFSSRRFSKHSELFCYLKIDMTGFSEKEILGLRYDIQEKLDELLNKAQAGCAIGGATGYVYSYIDLALSNVPASIDRIRTCFREMNLTHRAWLLFFDKEFADEWVGVAEDTPEPPGYRDALTGVEKI